MPRTLRAMPTWCCCCIVPRRMGSRPAKTKSLSPKCARVSAGRSRSDLTSVAWNLWSGRHDNRNRWVWLGEVPKTPRRCRSKDVDFAHSKRKGFHVQQPDDFGTAKQTETAMQSVTQDAQRSQYEFIDSKELAARWALPESWVREQVRSRAADPLPHIRFGKYVRFRWGSPE